MTDKLTIKDLNCGNCPKHSIKAHPIRSGNIHMCGDDRIDDIAPSVTREHGCASHPLALQVLAAPVIGELEKRITMLENARGHNMNLSGGNLSINLYKDVIKLLKEGVKKP